MFFSDEPEAETVLQDSAVATPPRRRIHPLTWAAFAAVMPFLGWDVWQTLQDLKHRQPAAQMTPSPHRFPAAFE